MANSTNPQYPALADYVRHFARVTPDAEALVHGEERWTYQRFSDDVDAFARSLIAAGVGKGDRIVLLSSPRPIFFISLLAAASIGAVWVGLHPRYKIGEMAHVIGEVKPKLVFAFREIDGRDYAGDLAELQRRFPGIGAFVIVGEGWRDALSLADFIARGTGASASPVDVDADDPAVIIFTSGSTGAPKGAVVSHRGLIHGALIEADRWPVRRTSAPRALNNMPINHIAGIGMIAVFTLVQGGAQVFQDRFDAGELLRLIARERVTLWLQSSAMFHFATVHPDYPTTDFSALETIVWAGAPMARDIVTRLAESGARLCTAFGMTELGTYATFSDADADHDTLAAVIGKPEPRYQLRIADAAGVPVQQGTQGEIQARGNWLFQGYYGAPERTAEAFTADGWFKTGDIAVERSDGNWQIVGRLKEMYKSGGFNIYPREIEIALEAHPKVAMAAVIGVADPLYHETGHAFVQPQPGAALTADDCAHWCKDKLANYKVPKRFTIMAELPRLANGKLDKMGLRKMLET